MWYNAWGEFSTPPWHILELEHQPYPQWPGTADRAEAMDRLTYIIPCLGALFATQLLILRRPSSLRTLTSIIFWAGVAVAILGLAQRWTGAEGIFWSSDLKFEGRTLFFGTFRSPGIATSYLNLALAMGLSLIILPPRKVHSGDRPKPQLFLNILKISGIIALLTASISAGSKAGMVMGLLTLTLWATLNARSILRAFRRSSELFAGNRRMERNLLTVVLLIIAVLATLSFAGTMIQRWEAAHESGYSTLAERGAANAIQLEMLQDEEWGALGFGPGSFYPLFPYFDKEHTIHGTQVYSHNDYLQTLIEWGWLGTAIFTLIIAGGWLALFLGISVHKKHYRESHVIMMRGYLIALTAVLLHATVDFPFQIESIALTVSAILGAAWASKGLRISS